MDINVQDVHEIDFNACLMSGPERYTCLTCNVMFAHLPMYKKHYTTEWHRYNLHRKLTGLSAITLKEFEKKDKNYRTDVILSDDKNNTKQILKCDSCRKKYNCKKQYINHLVSSKHLNNVKKCQMGEELSTNKMENENVVKVEPYVEKSFASTDFDWHQIDNQVENTIVNECLFCNHRDTSIINNIIHMEKVHSFFIPEIESCICHELLLYLAKKILLEYKCLWCNDSGRQMHSVEAARSHMIDKGHCKIRFDEEAKDEYLEFYDYRYTYPDWMDADPDEELSESEVFLDEGYELKLSTGKMLGHRSLMRYYKQHLKAGTVALKDQKSPRDNVGKMRNMMMQYNSLGGKSEAERAEKKKLRDVQYAQRIHTKYSTQLQSKQNKLQKHFRPQINF